MKISQVFDGKKIINECASGALVALITAGVTIGAGILTEWIKEKKAEKEAKKNIEIDE